MNTISYSAVKQASDRIPVGTIVEVIGAPAIDNILPADGSLIERKEYKKLDSEYPTNIHDYASFISRTNLITGPKRVIDYNGLMMMNAIAGLGHYQTYYTSTDLGINWTARAMPSNLRWNAYAEGPAGLKVFSYNWSGNTTNVVATTTDGINWTQETMPGGYGEGNGGAIEAAAYGNGRYLAACRHGVESWCHVLEDGGSWTHSVINTGNDVVAMQYGNGIFLLVRSYYNNSTTDGYTWSDTLPRVFPFTNTTACAYGNGVFVFISGDGQTASTVDGTVISTPTELPRPNNVTLTAMSSSHVTFKDGKFIACLYGASEGGVTWDYAWITISTDGINWGPAKVYGTPSENHVGGMTAIAWDGNGYVGTDSASFSGTGAVRAFTIGDYPYIELPNQPGKYVIVK